MYIITPNNEIYEYEYDPRRGSHHLLYLTKEVSLTTHIYSDGSLWAGASLPNHPEGIYLASVLSSSCYPVATNRGDSLGPHVRSRLDVGSEGVPSLGTIPHGHIPMLCRAIEALTSAPVKGYLDLQEKLREVRHQLQGP